MIEAAARAATISHTPDGTTTLEESIRDQTALYGLIARARDLGLTLVTVGRSAPSGLARDRSLGWNSSCKLLAH